RPQSAGRLGVEFTRDGLLPQRRHALRRPGPRSLGRPAGRSLERARPAGDPGGIRAHLQNSLWSQRAGRGARGDQLARGRERAAPGLAPQAAARDGYMDAAVFDRYALQPGMELAGPAIVEERESTLIIGAHGRARVDERLNIVVELRDGK